jgi:hypothetical protein
MYSIATKKIYYEMPTKYPSIGLILSGYAAAVKYNS